MGQLPNKYHMTEDGMVYRVNEDGSFTSIGNVEDLEKKPSSPSMYKIPPIPTKNIKITIATEVGWWKRNYNWLWVTTFVVFAGWLISCFSCARREYYDHTVEILFAGVLIRMFYWLSWYLSEKDKTILKFTQILIVAGVFYLTCQMYSLCDKRYSSLLVCLASIPVTMWIITLCLSIFRRR